MYREIGGKRSAWNYWHYSWVGDSGQRTVVVGLMNCLVTRSDVPRLKNGFMPALLHLQSIRRKSCHELKDARQPYAKLLNLNPHYYPTLRYSNIGIRYQLDMSYATLFIAAADFALEVALLSREGITPPG